MAFPTIEAVGETNGSTAATNKVCNLPTGIVNGSLLILELRSNVADTHSTPAGWTMLILNNTADASDDTTSIWYRQADGTEGATVTVNGTASSKFTSVSLRISGHSNPATQAPEISAVATGTSVSPNSLSLSPTGGAKDYLWLTMAAYEGEQTDPPTFPTNYTLGQVAASSGTAGVVATNSRSASAGRQLNASSEDPGAYTISASDDWTAVTIAVHPAPPATPARVTASETVLVYNIHNRVIASEMVLVYNIPARVTATESVLVYTAGVRVTGSEINLVYNVPARVTAGEIVIEGDIAASAEASKFAYTKRRRRRLRFGKGL